LTTLHYTAGNNFDAQGNYAPAAAGFNLADVSSVSELNALPAGVQGMVYLDQGDGVTQSFIDALKPYVGNSKVFGFYLKDEPDPTGQYNTQVTAANLKAESDYIHANFPGAKTFITMMNMGPSDNPTFADTYNPANTHIDLFGIDPYPVRSGSGPVDYSMIDKAVAAAESAGIPASQIVPVFQTFGGGNWVNDEGGRYVMPSAEQAQAMLDHWSAHVPNPAFDYAYAWGSQNGDTALESSPELQSVFLQHNTASAPLPADVTDAITTGSSGESAIPPTDPSGDATSGSNGGTHSAAADGTTVDGGAATGSSSGSTSSGSTSATTDGGHHHQNHHHQQQHSVATSATPSADATSAITTGSSGDTAPSATDSNGGTHAGSIGATIHDGVTAGASSGGISGDSTAATGGGHHHQNYHHHQALDFSQLTTGGTGAASGIHPTSSTPATAAAGSGAADPASTGLADAGIHPADAVGHHSDHHGGHHIDHHAWHF
jgi:hypothetical protein